ncbi:hypothetical protein AJ79_05589 [Helicocarpus griseus UAMH5409]|uniref:Uncharacterized protein n=1 Tax=Helicocarpus griseus UAMH5409 TaxID=1447875 RepID=A0A2B7XM36_9EURO|nr:hypothetical protein AJ79_05589 [Helicocarpus griseus UAMH5409]
MSSHLVLPRRFLSAEVIQLASLVPNLKELDLDALEPPIRLGPADFTVDTREDYYAFLQSQADSKVQALLSRFLRLSSERMNGTDTQIAAQSGRIYTLRKPAVLFKQLCKEDAVREWLQEQIQDGMDVYFVIGLHTLINGSTEEGIHLTSQHSGQVTAPLGDVASGLSVNVKKPLDAGLEFARGKNSQSAYHYVAPGERICSIRLKKVVFRYWEPHNADNARLNKNSFWKTVSNNRGDEYAEVVEAWLEGMNEEDGLTSGTDIGDEGNITFHIQEIEEEADGQSCTRT